MPRACVSIGQHPWATAIQTSPRQHHIRQSGDSPLGTKCFHVDSHTCPGVSVESNWYRQTGVLIRLINIIMYPPRASTGLREDFGPAAAGYPATA
jgi:hypothetical protein